MDDIAAIHDLAGRQIAVVGVHVDNDRQWILTPTQRSRHGLLRYYFQECGREVLVGVGDVYLRGGLRTHMDGTRRIWVLVLRRIEAGILPSMEAEAGRTVA